MQSLIIIIAVIIVKVIADEDYYDYYSNGNPDHYYGHQNPVFEQFARDGYTIYRGFPVGIACVDAFPLFDLQGAHCIIKKDGVAVINQTATDAEEFKRIGLFQEADDTWNQTEINVHVANQYSGESASKSYRLTLSEPLDFSCSNLHENHPTTWLSAGSSEILECVNEQSMGESILQVTEDLTFNYTLWWYKGCEKIQRSDPEYEYIDDKFAHCWLQGTDFADLRIKNATYTSTPGDYSCVVEKNSEDGASGASMYIGTKPVCMSNDYVKSALPIMTMQRKMYTAEEGADLRIQVKGHTAMPEGSLTQHIDWNFKGRTLCGHGIDHDIQTPDCYESLHKNTGYCSSIRPEEAEGIDERLDDNFTATFWIRNLTKDDEGEYTVVLRTAFQPLRETFVVRLREETDKAKSNQLKIVLLAIAGFLILAMMVLILLYKWRVDLRYYVKKLIARYEPTNKPIAFLIYSSDVNEEMKGALEKVTEFLGGRRFYDPNNAAGGVDANSAGMLIHDHVTSIMAKSHRLIIFVTADLMNGNDAENFEVYEGLENKIRRGLPVIFICSAKMRRKVLRDKFGKCSAIRAIMSKQKNSVIIWNENNITKFRRSLYMALPKVRDAPIDI